MKKFTVLLAVLVVSLPSQIFAYTAIDGKDQITIDKNIEDNAYIAGGKVNIDAGIAGDLYTAGGDIHITGNIRDNLAAAGGKIESKGTLGQDALFAGGEIRISGPTQGDLRATAGDITLSNSVGGDATLAGGNIRIEKEVQIGKDLGLAAGNITLNGHIKGKADIYTGMFNFNGVVEKDLTLHIDNANNIQIGPNAKIGGNLKYYAPAPIPGLEAIVKWKAEYHNDVDFMYPAGKSTQKWFGVFDGMVIYQLLSLLILGGLLLVFCQKFLGRAAAKILATPGKAYLNGVLYFIVTPFIVLILIITIVGIPVGLLALMLYIFSFVFAKLLVLVIATELLVQRFATQLTGSWQKWGIFALLAVILTFVGFINVILTPLVFGAFILMYLGRASQKQ